MANKLPWFTHDHDAHQDLALRAAIRKHGAVAGWIWWVTLELLHKHGNGDTLKMTLLDMAASMMVDKRTCKRVYKTLCKLQLMTRASFEHGPRTACTVVIENFRKRQSKLKFKVPSTLPQHSLNTPQERERERERERTSIAQAPPSKTTPAGKTESTDLERVVNAYKEAKGVGKNDKAWDKHNFARNAKAAKSLLECCGSWQKAAVYVISKGQDFDDKNLSWTLETIKKHAWDDRGKINESIPKPLGPDKFPVISTAGELTGGIVHGLQKRLESARPHPLLAEPNAGKTEGDADV